MGCPRSGPGERLTIVLVPATPVQGAIAGRAFVIDGDRIEPWPAPMTVSPEGALRIEGTGESLGLTRFGTGPRTLRIVAGRPDALPGALPDAGDRDGTKQGWQAFDFAVVLTE
jgi:hypothetical protein